MTAGRHDRIHLEIAFTLLHNYFFLCKCFSFKSYLFAYVAVCNIYVSAHVQNGLCKGHFERHFLVPLYCSPQLDLKVLFFLLLLCLRVQWCFRPIFDREFTTRSFKRKNSSSPELEYLLDFATICTVYDFLMMQVRNLLAALHYRWNFQMLSENCKNIYWLLNPNRESKLNTKINHTNETSFYLQKCILANRL